MCDALDVCPDIADSQFDLDRDGVGWACDPVESTTFPQAHVRAVAGSIHRDTAALVVAATCEIGEACPYTFFAASPTGALIARSDSADPADAWLHVPRVGRPLVTRHDHILVMRNRSVFDADTITVDPGTKQVDVRAMMKLWTVVVDGTGEPLAAMITQPGKGGARFVEPQADGSLKTVATAAEWFWDTGHDAVETVVTSDPIVLVPESHPQVQGSRFDLRAFQPGDSALTELAPPVTNAYRPQRLGEYRGAPTCAGGPTSVLIRQGANGVQRQTLPNACPTMYIPLGTRELYIGSGPADSDGDGAYDRALYVNDASGLRLVDAIAESGTLSHRVFGRELVVVVFASGGIDLPEQVVLLRPDGSSVRLATDLLRVSVSVAGGVAHVVGVRRPAGAQTGSLVAIRATATSIQEAVVNADATPNEPSTVVTTVEGAAVVSYSFFARIAPSGSFVFGDPIGAVQGFARGSHTVLFPNTNVGGKIFAYREVAGAPELVPMSNVLPSGFTAFPLDPPPVLPPTEYFYYRFGACRIGRVVDTASGPKLEELDCGTANDYFAIAVTRDGSLVVGDNVNQRERSTLFKLGSTGVKQIAGALVTTPILDRSQWPPLLLGWTMAGNAMCLDEQPQRCWKIPYRTKAIATFARPPSGPSGKAYVSQILASDTDPMTVAVVRSIGPGDPMP